MPTKKSSRPRSPRRTTASTSDGVLTARTVILANGEFPRRGGAAWQALASAKRIVACDGAAKAYRRRFGRWPDVIVGDLDSLRASARSLKGVRIVRDDDPDVNDLGKALRLCAARGWRNPVIVGASGHREDHLIGNVFRGLVAQVPIVSDDGTFFPVCGRATFRCARETGVSVFAPDPETRMTSRGLVWPLDGVRFATLFCATLNRTSGTRFSVTSDHPVYVYIAK